MNIYTVYVQCVFWCSVCFPSRKSVAQRSCLNDCRWMDAQVAPQPLAGYTAIFTALLWFLRRVWSVVPSLSGWFLLTCPMIFPTGTLKYLVMCYEGVAPPKIDTRSRKRAPRCSTQLLIPPHIVIYIYITYTLRKPKHRQILIILFCCPRSLFPVNVFRVLLWLLIVFPDNEADVTYESSCCEGHRDVIRNVTEAFYRRLNVTGYVCSLQLAAYGGNLAYTVSYNTDQQEQSVIRVTSEPDLIIEVSCPTTW